MSTTGRFGCVTKLSVYGAIGGPLGAAGDRPLGTTIRAAVEATACWTSSNTNLGIVLLLAPLAKAAHALADHGDPRRGVTGPPVASPGLRDTLSDVLQATTVDDAREVYAAIRLASPGGLGRADTEDVAEEPRVTLLEAMQLASTRDDVAYEYATAFDITFTRGAPALEAARRAGLAWDDAVVETFLTLAADRADTHVARRGGAELASAVAARARAALAAGGVRSEAGRQGVADLDAYLRQHGNLANPGTSADLTAAALFVVLLGGGWDTRGRH
jgi:triphosphoribosyl-dephospho-CoA synthase